MTTTDIIEYYEQRAEDHVELAQKSSSTQAVQAHYELASAYLDRIYGETEGSEGPD